MRTDFGIFLSTDSTCATSSRNARPLARGIRCPRQIKRRSTSKKTSSQCGPDRKRGRHSGFATAASGPRTFRARKIQNRGQYFPTPATDQNGNSRKAGPPANANKQHWKHNRTAPDAGSSISDSLLIITQIPPKVPAIRAACLPASYVSTAGTSFTNFPNPYARVFR